jgi:hypothetical protein
MFPSKGNSEPTAPHALGIALKGRLTEGRAGPRTFTRKLCWLALDPALGHTRKAKRVEESSMTHRVQNSLIFGTAGIFAISIAAVAASPPMNVRGTIAQVDGNTIQIKERDGDVAKVHLADNAKIVSVAKASLSDIKPGSFIGTAATPRTDGKLQAIEVHVFPESMRGTGEGTRAWDLTPKSSMTNGMAAPKSSMTNGTAAAKSSMTNGTVAQKSNKVENNKVNSVEGNDLTVNFNGGTKIVTVTSATKVVTLVPGDRSQLKADAKIFIPAATRTPDGTLEANRVTVGKDGIPPPM